MATARTKFAVGLFLLVGTLLAVAAIIWVGMSGRFKTGEKYAVYFDESVQGLDQDSPVKYRGVSVGRVVKIGVAPDGRLVEVIVQLSRSLKEHARLVAQLKSVGITGIMFIELDLAEEGTVPQKLPMSFKPPHPVIPSKPSEIQMIFRGLEAAFERIQELDVGGMVARVQNVLDSADRLINNTDVRPVLEKAALALDRVNEILASKRVTSILDSAEQAAREARAGAADARQTFATAKEAVSELSTILSENRDPVRNALAALGDSARETREIAKQGKGLVQDTRQDLENLFSRISEAVNNLDRVLSRLDGLLEAIEAHPGGLLFDAAPEPRRIAP